MTRVQRRSKSQLHNRMKRLGYKWFRRQWWQVFRFTPLTIALSDDHWIVGDECDGGGPGD